MKLKTFLVGYETSLNLPSVWRWAYRNSVFLFGRTYPLNTCKADFGDILNWCYQGTGIYNIDIWDVLGFFDKDKHHKACVMCVKHKSIQDKIPLIIVIVERGVDTALCVAVGEERERERTEYRYSRKSLLKQFQIFSIYIYWYFNHFDNTIETCIVYSHVDQLAIFPY